MKSYRNVFPVLIFLFLSVSVLFCADKPQKIVSLGPRITEQLFDLGAGKRVIADTEYCTRPAEAVKLPKVGNVIEVNVEAIASMKPDLVIGTDLNDRSRMDQLKKLGIHVEIFNQPVDFEGVLTEFEKIGTIIGESNRAANLVRHYRANGKAIVNLTSKLNRKSVFFQIGSNPLFTLPENSFMQDYIKMAGGTNIASDAGIGMFSVEQVAARNPDAIFIALMGIDGDNEIKAWKNYSALNAVKNNRIFLIDPNTSCSPTPATFIETLKAVAAGLYPELQAKLPK